ncbi:hypothetical protein N0B40_05710 [Chryseobacterium oranimense]|uniref:hypothetical protein n=1 Tax=Chryseobacterium oranimense TaxID=421058 RepID=UPI0021AE59A1|nr:hypothetical protein [Chryseobacterium oranimense]UWX61775.1 hypothetical protein N0B40_05710 [Chryseobacterium oranimense]
MNIKDKLRVEIRDNSISLEPNRGARSSLVWFGIAIITAAFILAIFYTQLGEGGRLLCILVMIYFFIRGIRDYVFHLNIIYEFDGHANAVYRDNLLSERKQIMRLDEVVIFTNNDCSDWHYSMGAKKKQFLKSYKISPRFGRGRISQQNALDYEKEILQPIEKLIQNCH